YVSAGQVVVTQGGRRTADDGTCGGGAAGVRSCVDAAVWRTAGPASVPRRGGRRASGAAAGPAAAAPRASGPAATGRRASAPAVGRATLGGGSCGGRAAGVGPGGVPGAAELRTATAGTTVSGSGRERLMPWTLRLRRFVHHSGVCPTAG